MTKQAPKNDPAQDKPEVTAPQHTVAGVPGVTHGLRMAAAQMGPRRALATLRRVNQHDGFDCPGCAWPEPDRPHTVEFCENGAKAVTEEATERRIGREFFAAHPVAELAERSGYWLGQQGRLT
jgi:hypothetical protein